MDFRTRRFAWHASFFTARFQPRGWPLGDCPRGVLVRLALCAGRVVTESPPVIVYRALRSPARSFNRDAEGAAEVDMP